MWIEEAKVFYDAESGFYWFDKDIPDFSDIRDDLVEEIRKYRFEKDLKFAYLNVTELCNAKCPYCYVPDEVKKRGRSFSRDELFEILGRLEGAGIEWVLFHGVEPLLEKELIFEAMDTFDFNYGIQTNGLLLEEEDMDFIMEKEANIGLSLDAPKRDVNDFLRGSGSFDAVCSAMEYMDDYEGLSIITTINRFNEALLPEMVDFLAGKVETVLMNPVRGTSKGGRNLRAVNLAENFLEAVERAMELTAMGERIVIADYANILLGILAPSARVLQCDVSPCGAGRRFISITPDGVYPCGEFIGMAEFRSRLDEALSSKAFERVVGRKVEDIGECRDCSFRHLCGAPCPAEIYAETGKLNEKSPYCEFYKEVIIHAFRTIREGKEGLVLRLENLAEKHTIELR
jgi:uncharacterized protein